ncbi:MAG: hypothetical protein JKX78_01070 [Alteromonadaceae bacterium]|nr:hypothetical protein [Alteromonadaceae bacterium]
MKCKREQLFGSWFRQEVDQQGIEHSEYANFTEDGSFEFTFISAQQGHVLEQSVEYGAWGLVGDVHFTITESELIDEEYYDADLTHEDNYHVYKVLQLNVHFFEYQHIVSKEIYLLKRTMTTTSYSNTSQLC